MGLMEEFDFDKDFLAEVIGNSFDSHDTDFSRMGFFRGHLPEGDDLMLNYAERIFEENSQIDFSEYVSFAEKKQRTREQIMVERRNMYGSKVYSRKVEILNAKVKAYKSYR